MAGFNYNDSIGGASGSIEVSSSLNAQLFGVTGSLLGTSTGNLTSASFTDGTLEFYYGDQVTTSSINFTSGTFQATASNALTASYVDVAGSGIIVNYNDSQIQLTGSGLPTGGITSQTIIKQSEVDGDVAWEYLAQPIGSNSGLYETYFDASDNKLKYTKSPKKAFIFAYKKNSIQALHLCSLPTLYNIFLLSFYLCLIFQNYINFFCSFCLYHQRVSQFL
jgi:hypothetical protein